MTRFFLLFAFALPLAACTDGEHTATMPMDADATHEMADGSTMDGAEHEHMAAGASDGPAEPEVIGGVQVVEIEAGPMGYQPRRVHLEAGILARLVFTRTVDDECSSQITLPTYDIAATDLPLNTPVAIEFTPTDEGEVQFVCGMDMQRGTLAIVS